MGNTAWAVFVLFGEGRKRGVTTNFETFSEAEAAMFSLDRSKLKEKYSNAYALEIAYWSDIKKKWVSQSGDTLRI